MDGIPVQQYKHKISKMMAKGFAENLRPFLLSEDYWIADVASFFTEIGAKHGTMSPEIIYDVV